MRSSKPKELNAIDVVTFQQRLVLMMKVRDFLKLTGTPPMEMRAVGLLVESI